MRIIHRIVAGLSLVLLLAGLAPSPASAHEPTMKFWARAQTPTFGTQQVQAYRVNNEMLVVIHDPLACGQTVDRPSLRIEQGDVVLHYDVGSGTASSSDKNCVSFAIFQIKDLPDRDLRVRFAGGQEPETVAYLKPCPSQQARSDEWDCLVPAN